MREYNADIRFKKITCQRVIVDINDVEKTEISDEDFK